MPRNMLLALISLVLLVGGGIWLANQQPTPQPIAAPAAQPKPAAPAPKPITVGANATTLDKAWQELEATKGERVTGSQVTFTVTQGAHKQWDVLVEKAIYFDDQQGAQLKGLHGKFYDLQGKPTAEFKAPYGTYDQAKERFELKGGVAVNSLKSGGNPMSLIAPTMVWAGNAPRIRAMGGVQLKAGTFATTTASEAAFSLDMAHVDLIGNAVSTLSQGS